MGTTIVTPTLLVGDVPATLETAHRATTTGEARQLIDADLVAVLPAGAWDLVKDVLRVLIRDHALVLQVLQEARTGETSWIQCDCRPAWRA